jgi:hypothetical protein
VEVAAVEAAAATMEAAAVETTAIAAASIAAKPATVITRAAVHPSTPAIPAISTIIAAAVIGSAVIPSGIERTAVTDPWVDGCLVTTRERNRERRSDCAQKNPTANHRFSPWPT